MTIQRVSIYYRPKLYTELFARVFQTVGSIEVVEAASPDSSPNGPARQPTLRRQVDVVVLPVDNLGRPDEELMPEPRPEAKLVAFSPKGDYGFRRYPGESEWEELRPFGLSQLVDEVKDGRRRAGK